MADLGQMLEHLKKENKRLTEALEDSELIRVTLIQQNEHLSQRLAKLGSLTARQELRARLLCACLCGGLNPVSSQYVGPSLEAMLTAVVGEPITEEGPKSETGTR